MQKKYSAFSEEKNLDRAQALFLVHFLYFQLAETAWRVILYDKLPTSNDKEEVQQMILGILLLMI